jgi:thiamine-phosphate pyrophosphorylase
MVLLSQNTKFSLNLIISEKDCLGPVFGLYVVTNRALSHGLSESEVARLAYSGGADIVQLRMKTECGKEMLEEAITIKRYALEYHKLFIVNDRIDIALLSDADGVHLGQTDIPVKEARKLLGNNKIIGKSVHNVEEAIAAVSEGADYLGVGSIFTTTTKRDAKQSLGLEILTCIKNAVDIPIVAIGGIDRDNVESVIATGVEAIAMVSAVVSENDIAKTTKEMKTLITMAKPNISKSTLW